MPVKDYLLRIMSVRTNIPEKTIEAVVTHQFEGVAEAMQNNSISSIEVSGFGKFLFNTAKAARMLPRLQTKYDKLAEELKTTESETKKKSIQEKMDVISKFLTSVKPRIDGVGSNTGRVEKQVSPTGRDEESDRGDVKAEDGNLQGLSL